MTMTYGGRTSRLFGEYSWHRSGFAQQACLAQKMKKKFDWVLFLLVILIAKIVLGNVRPVRMTF